ncbi:MAG: ankyrin repeat domain-containing protein [Gallionella sp.]|nr:ankyrin repeat domain-containing protein [Gallionella sp.]
MRQITFQLTFVLALSFLLGGCGTIFSRSNDPYAHNSNSPDKSGVKPSKVYSGVSSDIQSFNPKDSIPVLIDLPLSLAADTFLLPTTLYEQYTSDSRLQYAAVSGDIVAVRELLKSGASVDAMDAHGHSVLMSASWAGQVEIVRLLLTHKPAINVQHPASKESALSYAIKNKKDVRAHNAAEVLLLLLQSGAEPNLQDKDGRTALIHAVRMQNDEQVSLLLEHGADVNIVTSQGDSALLEASWSTLRYMDPVLPGVIVKALLEHGANVHARNNKGRSSLQSAVSEDTTVMTMLLANRADPNMQGECGGTPLMYASEYGFAQTVKLLIDSGANVNAKYSGICNRFNNETALTLARSGKHTAVINLLKNAGAQE